MTTLEIILIIILYIVIGIESIKPFKKFTANGWTASLWLQPIVWPITWALCVLVAIGVGFVFMWKNKYK